MEDHNWKITPWLFIILVLIFWDWDIELPLPELDAWRNQDLQEFFEGDD